MRLITFLAAWLLLTFPALARQDDPRLAELFAKLVEIEDARAAKLLEGAIWGLWMQSGSATVDLLLNRGTKAMGDGDYPTALQLFTSVVELDPKFSEGWNKRATLFFLMGALDRSLADVDKTLALEPRHFGALAGLGMINTQLGKDREALDAFEKAVLVNPHLESVKPEISRLKKKLDGSRI
jgi:tetratricopeptide (TPR) repeat protein